MPRPQRNAADDEVQSFIFDVELSAKKILKSHNKKAQEAAQRERLRATRKAMHGGAGDDSLYGSGDMGGTMGSQLARSMLKASSTSTLIVPAEMPMRATAGSSVPHGGTFGPSTEQPTLFAGSLGSTGGGSLGKRRVSPMPLDLPGGIGGGAAAVTMAGGTINTMGSASASASLDGGFQSGSLPALSGAGMSSAQLAVSRKLEQARAKAASSAHSSLSASRRKAAAMKARATLLKNPLAQSLANSMPGASSMSADQMSKKLKKTMAQLSGLQKLAGGGGGGGHTHTHAEPPPRAEHQLEKRQCHACLTDAAKMTGSENGLRNLAHAAEHEIELQGPVNWSADDLCRKYREEGARERAYEAYLLTKEEAARREREEGVILAVATVERHAVFVMADDLVNLENSRARRRARARNKMKVFVLDVHRVWETNLAYVVPEEESTSALKGIQGRRDVTAIEQGKSQLQSVSTVRALGSALEVASADNAHAAERTMEQKQREARLRERSSQVGSASTDVFFTDLPPPPELRKAHADAVLAPSGRACFMSMHELLRENADPAWRLTAYEIATGRSHTLVLPKAVMTAAARGDGNGADGAQAATLPEPGPTDGVQVHRQGLRRGGISLLLEIRVLEKLGQPAILMEAYCRRVAGSDDTGPPRMTKTRLLYALAAEVNEMLEAYAAEHGQAGASADGDLTHGVSKRPRTLAWWTEHDRATVWRKLVALVQATTPGSGEGDAQEASLPAEALDALESAKRQRLGSVTPGIMGSRTFWSRVAPMLQLQSRAAYAGAEAGDAEDDEMLQQLELRLGGHANAEEGGGADWEAEAAPRVQEQPLSMRVCGRAQFIGICPGTTVIGPPGLPGMLSYELDEEHTQAIAMFVRDAALSSTNSVLAMICLGLDTACLAPLLTAWIIESSTPDPTMEPWPPGKTLVPRMLNAPATLMAYPVRSLMDTITAETILTQCDCEDPFDYLQDKLNAKIGGKKQAGHRRLWDEHSYPGEAKGFFRQWYQLRVFEPDPVVSSRVFGVTTRGAQPNTPGSHGRHNWHSEQRCVETLCKRRVEKDYAYVAHCTRTQGANDPNTYSCMMQHEVIRDLEASRLLEYLVEHRRLQIAAKHKAEQEALKAKIEAGKAALAAKRKEQERIERQLNAKEATRLRRNVGKAGGLQGSGAEWKLRIKNSTLLREWEDWQQRRCNETDTVFYHSTDTTLVNPSQWDPPADWPFKGAAGGTVEGAELGEFGTQNAPSSAPSSAAAGNSGAASATGASAGAGAGAGASAGADSGVDFADIGELRRRSSQNALNIDDIARALAQDMGFLEKLKVKLGMAVSDSEDEAEIDTDTSDAESSDNDDEEGGRSHQQGSGVMPGSLQQHHGDRRRDELAARAAADLAGVPPLSLDRMKANRGKGWRKLKGHSVKRGLLSKSVSTHTLPAKEHGNSCNTSSLVGMVDPVEGCSYELPDQNIPVEVVLIKDIMADTERLAKEQAELMGTTVIDAIGNADAEVEASKHKAEWERKALMYVKNGKLAELEEALDEDVGVDTADEHGCTLFILACQQGNKRVAKFLLRRGAKMNAQTLDGNTCLHYCYFYNYEELAEYLKSHGADDSLLNADGLTCYEGLNQRVVDQI